jgi:hypothetical protein
MNTLAIWRAIRRMLVWHLRKRAPMPVVAFVLISKADNTTISIQGLTADRPKIF